MKKRAFTIIEFVMMIVILAIIAGASVPLIVSIVGGWRTATSRNDVSDSVRVAMDRMVREIRMVANKTSVIGANSNTFQFVNIAGSNITFSRSGSTLQRTQGSSVNSLADNVSGLSFTYYAANGSTISVPMVSPNATDIRRIEVSLTYSLGGTTLNSYSGVSPRRLNE